MSHGLEFFVPLWSCERKNFQSRHSKYVYTVKSFVVCKKFSYFLTSPWFSTLNFSSQNLSIEGNFSNEMENLVVTKIWPLWFSRICYLLVFQCIIFFLGEKPRNYQESNFACNSISISRILDTSDLSWRQEMGLWSPAYNTFRIIDNIR